MRKLLIAAAAYLGAYVAVSVTWVLWTNDAYARNRRAVELGEAAAAALEAPKALPALREACRGKLTAGPARTIAAYVARSAVKPRDDNHWDQVLLGVRRSADDDGLVTVPTAQGFAPVALERSLLKNLNPADWKSHLAWAQDGEPDLARTRYLLVAKYFSLGLPANQGTDGYTRGSGDFSARVLAFPSGEVLCAGRGEVHMKETVSASGRGGSPEAARVEALDNAARLVHFVFSESVMTSPLHALCDVGGAGLCRLTAQWVGR